MDEMKIPKEKYWSYLPFHDVKMNTFFFPHATKVNPSFIGPNKIKMFFWNDDTSMFGMTWIDPNEDYELEDNRGMVIRALFTIKNLEECPDL
jgi:hypothetical protein